MGFHSAVLDERSHLHDWRDSLMVEHRDLERANEMIHMSEAIAACSALADALMLHMCSTKMHGRSLAHAVQLQEELHHLSTKAGQFARHF